MKYKIDKGLIVQRFGDKSVIFDSDKSVLYTFNETAAYIFKKLKKGLTEETIVKDINKRYGIRAEKANKDLKDLISDLKGKKIIKTG